MTDLNGHEQHRHKAGPLGGADWCFLCMEAWPCKDGRIEALEAEVKRLRAKTAPAPHGAHPDTLPRGEETNE